MTKTSTRILHMLAADPAAAAAKVLADLPAPERTAPCCNPDCAEPCTWDSGRNGPPPRFHDQQCRMKYARKRREHVELLDAYRRLLEEGNPTYDQRRKLKRRLQSVQMQLDRYPSLG